MKLTHISLFTGIGGIDLAAEWAGFETVLIVENNAYCQKVLRKHWPDVPILEDIFNVTKETIQEALANAIGRGEQQSEGDISEGRGRTSHGGEEAITNAESFRWSRSGEVRSRGEGFKNGGERQCGNGYGESSVNVIAGVPTGEPDSTWKIAPNTRDKSITLITGGFPCQPFSVAGKQRGKEDDRYLWPEMLRVIKEVRPRWVVAENVAGLITMGLDDCLSDLEREGYITETFLIPACAVNAPHRRDRIFIVAHYESSGLRPQFNKIPGSLLSKDRTPQELESGDEYVADPDNSSTKGQRGHSGKGLPFSKTAQLGEGSKLSNAIGKRLEGRQGISGNITKECQAIERSGNCDGERQWAVEPDVGRVAHGIPSRVDRLKGLGNAVAPPQIYPILRAIADIERGRA